MTTISADQSAYRPARAGWDEMMAPGGELRPPWAWLGPAVSELGVDELLARQQEAERLLDDDGVTYHVHSEHDRHSRRWALDPVPAVVDGREWAEVERGVAQRALLLDLVLTDLYGPRDLVRRRILPPALVHGDVAFLRPCDQIRHPGRQLVLAGFDLGRAPDGRLLVLSDRTEAPAGAGYALENRVVTSRVLPSIFRDAGVQRLAPFFRTLRAALEAAAPARAGEPRTVILTPGPLSETAFEHAYLAAYLGYPLVEGSDLVMRDGRIWLRSLGHDEPVDVILRRVDDAYCDPLELRGDSRLGVAGLLEACRRGTVSVANPIGSGLLESPGLRCHLPTLAEHLLGEPLLLGQAGSWWGGDPAGLKRILAEAGRLVLRRTGVARSRSTFGWLLSNEELDALVRQIAAAPETWVGEEYVEAGSLPTLSAGGLVPRRGVYRTYAAARPDGYTVMPGGLTRVAATETGIRVTSQAGAISKDTWVLGDEPEPASDYWLTEGPAVAPLDPDAFMSSRAAENLFWLGRYAERAEGLARVLRVVHQRRNEFAHTVNPAGTACVEALLSALCDLTITTVCHPSRSSDEVGAGLERLVFDADLVGSLAFAVRRMLDAATAVRDQLSGDTWLVVADLDRDLLGTSSARSSGRATLGRVMRGLLALSGVAAESMVRDPGWRFLELGRRVERAIGLSTLLRSSVVVARDTATDSLLLESVLTTAESIITYRRRNRSHAQVETLLELLLTDEENPRSLAFQLDRTLEEVDRLPGPRSAPVPELLGLVATLARAVEDCDTVELGAVGPHGRREALDLLLGGAALDLARAADLLAQAYLVQLEPQQSLQSLQSSALPQPGDEP